MEEWKPVVGFDGLYQVSNLGRVKSLNYNKTGEERLMTPSVYSNGYLRVKLAKNKVRKLYLVHRLVAMAFIPNPYNLPCINHKDENPSNNCVENLEWCTQQYNLTYGTRIEKVTKKTRNDKRSKQIAQYSLDGELVKVWPSSHEIERVLGFRHGNCTNCCRGYQKTAYGFIWRYA